MNAFGQHDHIDSLAIDMPGSPILTFLANPAVMASPISQASHFHRGDRIEIKKSGHQRLSQDGGFHSCVQNEVHLNRPIDPNWDQRRHYAESLREFSRTSPFL